MAHLQRYCCASAKDVSYYDPSLAGGRESSLCSGRPAIHTSGIAAVHRRHSGAGDLYLESRNHFEPLVTTSSGLHVLGPGDVSRIYDFHPYSFSATIQTIAVIGASAVDLADIRQFRSTFKLPPNDPQILLAGDDPGTASTDVLAEADADLEWAGLFGPVLYAYATDVMVASQKVIDDNQAQILTLSFGDCEANISQTDAAFVRDLAQQANAEGITWIASRGTLGLPVATMARKQPRRGWP